MLICFSFIKVLHRWCTCLSNKFHNKALPTYLHATVLVLFYPIYHNVRGAVVAVLD